jgi:hypothetical protein
MSGHHVNTDDSAVQIGDWHLKGFNNTLYHCHRVDGASEARSFYSTNKGRCWQCNEEAPVFFKWTEMSKEVRMSK